MPKILDQPKQHLIDSARALLIENGARTFSIRQVTQHAGIALGTFYNYFDDKEQLLGEIFRADFMIVVTPLSPEAEPLTRPLRQVLEEVYLALSGFLTRYAAVFPELSQKMAVEQSSKEQEKLMGLQMRLSDLLAQHPDFDLKSTPLTSSQLSFLVISHLVSMARNPRECIAFDAWYRYFFNENRPTGGSTC